MKTNIRQHLLTIVLAILTAVSVHASDKTMEAEDHGSMGNQTGQFGDLIHQSEIDGYTLTYYFMDLRDQKTDPSHGNASNSGTHDSHDNMELEKPHHLMVFIKKGHTPVLEGKIGFLIVNGDGTKQKGMGMFMSDGFGTTMDMKKKGIYTVKTKAVVNGKKLMDSFKYEIK